MENAWYTYKLYPVSKMDRDDGYMIYRIEVN